jgi:hypothetical protein
LNFDEKKFDWLFHDSGLNTTHTTQHVHQPRNKQIQPFSGLKNVPQSVTPLPRSFSKNLKRGQRNGFSVALPPAASCPARTPRAPPCVKSAGMRMHPARVFLLLFTFQNVQSSSWLHRLQRAPYRAREEATFGREHAQST